MWKLVTRGIRESLERRASCRTNIHSQTPGDNRGTTKSEVKYDFIKNHKFLAPNIVVKCNSGPGGSTKTDGPKYKKYNSKWDTRRSWSEAVGWSSALAVGWVVCQSLCFRRRPFKCSTENKWHNHFSKLHSTRFLFVDTFGLHPQPVLPITNCIANNRIDQFENNAKQEWLPAKPYGPITIEEALKEAKDDYTKTHRIVMGEFELRFGIKALEEKRYKDAVKHFTTGANLSSSGSMFNLGLCHELGIGTLTDTIQAAKYYKNAADRGHPDAMYNLGVFHAQGRGGMSSNANKARELFIQAANLGQMQAQLALNMEKKVGSTDTEISTIDSSQTEIIPRENHVVYCKTRTLSSTLKHEGAIALEELCNESERLLFYNRMELTENSTNTFLNSLGIQTNRHRILVNSSDCNASYYT
ncbi:uncharacterized protein [Venturia canescens]|uniref:uncharacterized protein n=1 Tax=Venturia canescens TaxID=32260 RepID=UPI001C9C6E43|nr:uncharacterized protein LOC122412980 [Venturia canescens]